MNEPRVVVDRDAGAVGVQARAALDAGVRVAGFVGDETVDGDGLAEFVADVVDPPQPG